jgi:hypothetical protein
LGLFGGEIMSLSDIFLMMASCSVNKGDTIYFWQDTWNSGVLKWSFPQLFSFALNKNISFQAFNSGDLQRHFWTPLSLEASADQLEDLQDALMNLSLNPLDNDRWSYIWNNDEFSTKQAYMQIIGIVDASPIFRWMWKSCARGKHRFFFWLLLHDRLSTMELLKRKNKDLSCYNCVHYPRGAEESLVHLFFDGPFSKWWLFLNIPPSHDH